MLAGKWSQNYYFWPCRTNYLCLIRYYEVKSLISEGFLSGCVLLAKDVFSGGGFM